MSKSIFQCDLAGADGWSVAAHCARFGDPTMLDDYRAGLKPANIIALMYEFGADITRCDRAALKAAGKLVDKDGWLYFACKRVQHGCYTAGHEVLTRTGWKPIEFLLPDEDVMVYSLGDRHAWFERPQRLVSFSYTGTLFRFAGTAYDLEVTHDHKMAFETNGNEKATVAFDLARRRAAKLPTAANYVGGTLQVLYPRLVAAFQADGCLTDRGYITFHFKKERKVERLKALLDTANIAYTCAACADETYQFAITSSAEVQEITKFGKHCSAKFFEWNAYSLREYLDEQQYWDGHKGATSLSLFSTDEAHHSWLSTFYHLSLQGTTDQGWAVSGFGSLVHKLNINRRSYASLANLQHKTSCEVTDVPVYCLTVSTGFVLVRRNGKITVSGNSNYGMKESTMSDQIVKDSYKLLGEPIQVRPVVCRELQHLYFRRYPGILSWHRWVEQTILNKHRLVSASGHVRRFFGRKREGTKLNHETFKAALAEEPQANTTYATNLALEKLWFSPENRRANGALRVEPLHQVHDALIGQFDNAEIDFALPFIRRCFDNPLTIAGITLTIPFEGAYGPSWGELHNPI